MSKAIRATESSKRKKKMEKKKIDRRKFLKTFGVGAAAATAGLYGCKTKGTAPSAAAAGEVPTDRMTFRTCPSTGDRVSLLGYGCMRWPLLESPAADGNPIDQEAVNELVDYAIAHGVNYFDTAPVYIQGFSEKSTGIALKRHPREKVFIATKMSNHRMAGRGMSPARIFKDSEEMYRRSLRDLQTDYLDYYLLHAVGGDKGIETFNERFIDCGVLDFLLREREAGRIRNLGWSFHGDQKVFDHLLAMHDSGEARWDFVQIQMNYVDWKHASDRNVNAEYLYGELEKRGIPAVIMEPLLGGRLSRLNDHLVERLKERRPTESTASWAFRYAGSWPGVLTVLSGRALGNKEKPGDMKTPEGLFSVQQIQDASAWTHDFGDGKGEIRGAYGSHFIRLKTPGHCGIGIHGTHDPASIGTRATEGCVRLNNSDLLELVKKYVYVGMPVVILTSEADSAVPCRFPAAVKAGPRLMAQTE